MTTLPAGPEAVPFEPDPTVPPAKGRDKHPAVRQVEKAGRDERARITFARDLLDRHTGAALRADSGHPARKALAMSTLMPPNAVTQSKPAPITPLAEES
ncbi:hypothetical protein OHS18_23015 [Amycolatopsis sp. NBC_00355]|uniref:hypothetical protein n=1 Tax=Amycolatopsis sp. NBC_00355 TaxID=2975957 RepID=UPI002E256CCE